MKLNLMISICLLDCEAGINFITVRSSEKKFLAYLDGKAGHGKIFLPSNSN